MSGMSRAAAVRGQHDRREVTARCLLYYRGDAPHAKRVALLRRILSSVRLEPRVRTYLGLRTRSQDEGALMPNEMYGRTELEWEALEAAGWDFLITRAKGRVTHEQTTPK